jgi:histidinol-phosphatase
VGVHEDLEFAHKLADAADAITTARFQALDLRVDTKPDLTPASEADSAAEEAVRRLVRSSGRGEGVVGEELEEEVGDSRWIVDPIDGTKNYVRGMPVWATLLALEREGRLQCALASAPLLARRWWATRGGGTYVNGKRCSVSKIARIEDAYISTVTSGRPAAGLQELIDRAWSAQSLGGFWQHCLVAEGVVDVACQPRPRLWDAAATTLIVAEAGGRVTTYEGGEPADAASYVTTNGLLHDEVVQLLSR